MSNPRQSLVERAAALYDFGSGPPAAPRENVTPLPPRRRVVPAPAVAEPQQPVVAPVAQQAPPQLEVAQPRLVPAPVVARQQRPVAAPTHQIRVELDCAALAKRGFLTPDNPAGSLAEEMRLIKRRLLAAIEERSSRDGERSRVVLISSGQPGDGKTFVAINLALSLAAEQDRRVLLVDGDASKPDLLKQLGIEEGKGFIDALADRAIDPEVLVIDTDVPHLSLLPAGRRERNVPELLASARTQDVFARLLSADPNRIIIVDSPPALAASPASALADHAGQTLVVVRADRTSESDLNETIDLLSACDQISLVLNSTAFRTGGRRYGQYEEYR